MCVFGGRSEWGEPAAAVCPYAHDHPNLAVGESSVILLHPPLPVVGASIVTERERQQMTVSSMASRAGRLALHGGQQPGQRGLAVDEMSARCQFAAPPSPFSRRFNRHGEGVSS